MYVLMTKKNQATKDSSHFGGWLGYVDGPSGVSIDGAGVAGHRVQRLMTAHHWLRPTSRLCLTRGKQHNV